MRVPIAALLALLLGIALVPMSAAPALAAGSTFSVDCAAKGHGNGSAARPWNSLSAVNDHRAFRPGDRILLKRGTRCHGRLHPAGSGAAGAPIVIGAYGSGAKPLIVGGGTSNRTAAVQLFNQHDWTIQDLRVTNTGRSTSTQMYRSGVSVRADGVAMPGLTIQRLDVFKVSSAPNDRGDNSRAWGGITVVSGNAKSDPLPGLRILDNTMDGVGRSGIFVANWSWNDVRGHGIRISGNRIDHARGDGIVVYGLDDSRIDHNVVTDAHDMWPCPLCGPITPTTSSAGIWPAMSSRIRIDHNEVSGTKALGGDGEAFDVDGGAVDIVFEYNYAHDNEAGGILFCGSTNAVVRFNVFQDNRRSAFAFIGNVAAHGTRIYNNTVYSSKKTGAKAVRYFNGTSDQDVWFANNIIENHGDGTWMWPSDRITTRANTVVGAHGVGEPHDRLTSTRIPGLKKPGSGKAGFGSLGGYRPRSSGKPARGVAIPSDVTRDFFGKRIDPKRPPRGAAG